MKIDRTLALTHAVLLLILSPTGVNAETTVVSGAILPPSNARIGIAIATIAEPVTAAASMRWIDISDCTSETRERFFTGFQQLETLVNHQVDELTARRATTNGSAAAELDLGINEMRTARFFLQFTSETLRRATAQTWDQQKAKVGLAWAKSQEAYQKFKTRAGG